MPVSVLIGHLLLLAAQLSIGLALGWILWSRRERIRRNGEPRPRDLRRALSLLHQMTTSISDDVRAHSSRIDTSSKQLAELKAEGGDAGEIIAVLMPVIESNKKLQSELAQTEEQLQQRATELNQHMSDARTDALTGLLNRRGFDEEFARLLDDTESDPHSVFLLLLDIDHFKSVNDTHGHDAGDAVLGETARVIAGAARSVDSVARFGGEEFVVLVPRAELADARHVAVQIRRAVEANTVRTPDAELNVTVSIGVAQWSDEDSDSLVKRVDTAMYAAKNAGRNRVFYHTGNRCVALEPSLATPRPDAPAADPRSDEATGLPTRFAFVDELSRRLSQVSRTRDSLSLTVYEIENLEQIGKQHDDHTADIVRRAIAEFLVNLSRDMDLVADVDGERFAVMLPGCGLAEAHRTAERVRRAAGDCLLELPNGEILPLKLSAGVAERKSGEDADTLLGRAESAAADSQRAAGDDRPTAPPTASDSQREMETPPVGV